MRSEGNEAVVDCDDPMTVIACTTDTSACPAACREAEDNTDVVVKAGDLAVTAKPAADRKVIVPSDEGEALSDLDTLSFKSSEEVTITKITLERYGYSSNEGIKVSLEDEDGNVIADPKPLDSKGQAKLSIKKDYRAVDGSLNATVVLSATNALAVGSTIGFKVIAVESSAENLNLDNYKPYTYDVVVYDGSTISFTVRGASKEYNYEAGKSYEIAKFQVKAPADTAILARGFTLKNDGELDLNEFLDKVSVTFDGKDVKGLKYSTNKNKELVISFDEVEIAAKKNGTFVVNMTLSDDYDEYNKGVHAYIASTDKFSAVDKKTESRVRISNDMTADSWATSWPTYTFKGGKIKITNTKLGKVEAAYGSEDVVVAEGKITTSEALDNGKFKIKVNNCVVKSGNDNLVAIEKFTMYVNGDEFDGTKGTPSYTSETDNYVEYTFEGVEIEESGKIQFKVDLVDDAVFNGLEMSFASFGSFLTLEYAEPNTSAVAEVSGSITFSKLKIQPAKASLKNTLDKDVEFIKGESERKEIFNGTYTAKKGDVTLTEFVLSKDAEAADKARVTFYVTVGDEEAEADPVFTGGKMTATNTLNDILVKQGESVKVVVEAEIDANSVENLKTYTLALHGEDENGVSAGNAQAKAKAMKVVNEGSVTVEAASASKTVLYQASSAVLAQFTVKPANAETVDIESITFDLNDGDDTPAEVDITLEWGDDDTMESDSDTEFAFDLNETAKSEGITFKIVLNEEYDGTLAISNLKVNGKSVAKTFTSRFEKAVVSINKLTWLGAGGTQFGFNVKKDNDVSVKYLTLTFDDNTNIVNDDPVEDVDSNTTVEVTNKLASDIRVKSISYYVCDNVLADEEECAPTDPVYYTDEEIEAHNAELDIWDATTVKTPAGCVVTTDTEADADKTYYSDNECKTEAGTFAAGVYEATDPVYYTDEEIEAHNAELDIWDATTVKTEGTSCASAAPTDCGQPVTISRTDFPDFFKLDGSYARAYGTDHK